MPDIVCPNCGADIDDDLLESTGRSACPMCGTGLSPDLFVGSSPPTIPTSDDTLRRRTATTSAGALTPPGKSKVQVVEQSDDRLVFYIPPGGKGMRGLGCFALMWNGFMVVFTPPWFFAKGGGDVPWFVFLLIASFWAVGLGMVYFWITTRFTRTYVLLEPARIVVQRILLGRKKIEEAQIGPHSCAELVSSYEQNDQPVYTVAVKASDDTVKFGTALSDGEKEWFVDAINAFLGVGTAADESKAEIEDHVPPVEIAPRELPPGSQITILDAAPGDLRFQLPAFPPGVARIVSIVAASGIGCAWIASTLRSVFVMFGNNPGGGDWLGAVFSCAFALFGLIPLSFALFALRGKITVEMSDGALRCRWHIGVAGKSKSVPAAAIQRVAVRLQLDTERVGRKRNNAMKDVKVCVVEAPGAVLPLTSYHDIETARQVAGLVRYQLREMGYPLP